MKYNNLIESIFLNELNAISEDFKAPVIKYIEEKYSKYLEVILENKGNSIANKYIKLLEFNLKSLFQKSNDELKSMLSLDENFNSFLSISNQIFQIATLIKQKNGDFDISENEIKKYSDKLKELYSMVENFNKERASLILSECLIELEYISGKQVESLRMKRNM